MTPRFVKVRLTPTQADLLITACGFLLLGEWDETLAAGQAKELRTAEEKLKSAVAEYFGDAR